MAKIKGIKLELGGENYVVPPLPLGALEQLQERIESFSGGLDKQSVSTVIDCLYCSMVRNYPNCTREEVAGLVDVGNMGDVMQAIMDVSGMLRKKQEADAKAKAGNSRPRTSGGKSTRKSLPILDKVPT